MDQVPTVNQYIDAGLLEQFSQVARAISMLFDSFMLLIASQVLGCEVSQVLNTKKEINKWLSVLVSQGRDLKSWGLQVVMVDCIMLPVNYY